MTCSAVYEGWVRHRRHAPHPHAFRYKVAQLYLDLDEIDSVFSGRWLWSVNRRNLAEFRRSDYLGRADVPLAAAVRDCVQSATGTRPAGPIRLLTHLRYAGFCFNPVSFYYCFGPDGACLEYIVAEITNTPWHERHAYVLPVREAQAAATAAESGPAELHMPSPEHAAQSAELPAANGVRAARALHWSFAKTFHVSPFMAMDRRYDWNFTVPDQSLYVHMDVRRANSGSEFDALLVLQRRPLTAAALRRVLLRYPLMTAQVVTAIHWQALRLWLKGNPVHTHPSQSAGPT